LTGRVFCGGISSLYPAKSGGQVLHWTESGCCKAFDSAQCWCLQVDAGTGKPWSLNNIRMKSSKQMTPPGSGLTRSDAAGSHPGETSPKVPLKVALVEDQPKVREIWNRLINSFPDFRCVCACASGGAARHS